MDLSVMFFGADDAGDGAGHAAKYADILDIARAADRLGFSAVWTPERHFQQFGQVFPSPPVLSAALAVATERIAVRAGSVVLPLHHPLRIVEDWAVVDNLSGGRIGFSVATGWHSTDFVLAPDKYADRRAHAITGIEQLRRLWAGEPVTLPDGTGEEVSVRPSPRPVSPTLPLWLTASGSKQTWETAGQLRTGVLSATVGQTRDELVAKMAAYRDAYAAAPPPPGTPGAAGTGAAGTGSAGTDRGTVTLMAHTYVGTDDADALRRVNGPLRAYLKSYVAQTTSSRGADGRVTALAPADLDTLAEFALRRYLAWGSLLGSAQTCAKTLADLRDLGCDEVACFIDFGLGRDEVLAGLYRLADLREDIAS
jgi:natural product biosynthesis luciferase-like monooxygenase protein